MVSRLAAKLCVVLLAIAAMGAGARACAQSAVDLQLVLAVDVSGSVSDERFRGRIVLVGATALERPDGSDDVHVVRDGLALRQVFGVELQADAIATLASGRVPQLLTVGGHLATTVLACVVGAAAALALYRRPRWWRRAALLALALTWMLVAWWLAMRDIVLNAAHDVIAMLLSYLALRATQWFTRTFQRLRRPST